MHPKNCLNGCTHHQKAECPAIQYEQTQHVEGISRMIEGVTPIIGCASFGESEKKSHKKGG
jgi:hypothetical protein